MEHEMKKPPVELQLPNVRDEARGYGQHMVPEHADERPHGHAALLAAVVASLPEMQRHGVRRLTVGMLTIELERVHVDSPTDRGRPHEGVDLDLAHLGEDADEG